MPKFTACQIDYNEEKNIHNYLDTYGVAILHAFTSGDTTIEEGLDAMREYYGPVQVNMWILRNPEATKEVFCYGG